VRRDIAGARNPCRAGTQEEQILISKRMRTLGVSGTLAAVFLSLLLSACSGVKLISDYDEPTDKALTALQQLSDDFIVKMIADAPSEKNAFDKQKQFYDAADEQLRRLEFRVGSIPKNEKTVALVGDIRDSLLGDGKCSADGTSLKDLHCNPDALAKGPSKAALQIARRNTNQTIGAALALEIAKRQGLESNK
jgi:hypothetical protein